MIKAWGKVTPDAILTDVGLQARRRIARRLLPFLFILYLIAFLDRVNVGYAGLEMSRELSFTDRVFGLGAGIFFVGYFLFEIPGALIVERWSARRWIARILISWGFITVLVSLIKTPAQFYTARFFLGAAEAGFFPGIVVYLTHWFRHEDRARAGAWFFSAIPFSNVVGSPLAGWLLDVHWFGVAGWRWLFVLEGVPAVVLGIVTLFYLTDWPHQADWLHQEEREWIQQELQREKEAKRATLSCTVWQALRMPAVLLLALIYFLSIAGLYGFNFWFPTILKRATGLPNFTVTSLAAMPYVLGLGAMLWFGWHSDRKLERRWHTAWPLFLCAVQTVLYVGLRSSLWLSLGSLILACSFTSAFMPSFWALPTALLSESAAAASIGLINSVGNLGGLVGPYLIGYFVSLTHSFTPGLLVLVAGLLLAGILVLRLGLGDRPS